MSSVLVLVLALLLLPAFVQGQATQLFNSNAVFVGHVNACTTGPAGGTDTYACTLDRTITVLTPKACFSFVADVANTGPASINYSSLGAKAIVKMAGGIATALVDNDIRAGQFVATCYDGTNMQMQSQLGNAATGTLAASGTPTAGQVAEWVTASTLQGVDTTGTGNYVRGTSPTLTTPTIASLVNATHTHTNAAGGGQLTDASLSTPVTIAKGGTGTGSTLTGLLQGSASAFTAVTSSTVGQALRVTGTNTFAFGALDLADTDAITNDLPYANLTPATAASRLLGRGDATAGDWQEVTLGSGLTMTGTTLSAAGSSGVTTDTIGRAAFYNATTTVDGAAGLTFATDGTTVTSYADRITTLSTSATLGVNDGPVVSCDATAGSVTATLPDGTATPSAAGRLSRSMRVPIRVSWRRMARRPSMA